MLAEGFSSWTKRDFNMFLRASERYGRNDIDKIASSVTTKTKEEVQRYHEVFWKRVSEIDGMCIVAHFCFDMTIIVTFVYTDVTINRLSANISFY